MSNITGACADYVREMMLEIGANFYPLAAVNVPDHIVTYPLDAIEDEYSFEAEHLAVEYFSRAQEADRLASEKASKAAENQNPTPNSPQSNSSESSEPSQTTVPPAKPKLKPEILQPQSALPLIFPKPLPIPKRPQLSFEDFESTSNQNPFDALEIKTLDDKAALRQILAPNSNISNSFPEAKSCLSNGVAEKPKNDLNFQNHSKMANFCVSQPVMVQNGLGYGSLSQSARRPDDLPQWQAVLDGLNGQLKPSKSSPDLTQMGAEKKEFLANRVLLEHEGSASASHSMESIERRPVSNITSNRSEPSMTDEQRSFVDSMCSMGFERTQVIRTVNRGMFGMDKGKVVNYLLLVQSLSRGGWPVELVEEAVCICDMNEEKASQYTRIALQLRDLGFDHEHIVSALKMCQGSRDKALEHLLKH